MFGADVWRRMVGVDKATVIESVEVDEELNAVVAHVRPRKSTKRRCGRCGVRAPGYDQGEAHGPTVAQVPWARHDAGHTRHFDDQVAWLVTHTPKSAVSDLMGIAWRTVGSVIARVVADGRAAHDPFCGLRRIGIDEISYKRRHRYLTVVVDHDSGRLVSADGAEWIANVVQERCPNATLCIDAFHVVQWATDALDEVRRDVWNSARRSGMTEHARELKGARFALWKNPEDLTRRQRG